MAQEIPVYVFTGFMDSGKTSLVQETLFENEFGEGAKGVIIMCEDGEKEYDEAKLATVNFKLTGIENEEDFTEERLQQINDEYLPEQVFIEYNGTWGMDKLLEAYGRFGLNPEDYWWYTELRKYGGTHHAGFGLGFERLIMYITGVSNIRDVEAFPRTTGNAEF